MKFKVLIFTFLFSLLWPCFAAYPGGHGGGGWHGSRGGHAMVGHGARHFSGYRHFNPAFYPYSGLRHHTFYSNAWAHHYPRWNHSNEWRRYRHFNHYRDAPLYSYYYNDNDCSQWYDYGYPCYYDYNYDNLYGRYNDNGALVALIVISVE